MFLTLIGIFPCGNHHPARRVHTRSYQNHLPPWLSTKNFRTSSNWVQGRPDVVHDYRDPDSPLDLNEPERFAHFYRAAGGEIELLYIDNAERSTAASFDPLARFFRKHLTR